MHAGEAGNSRGQRANGGKISAITVKTAKLAGKQEEKCTPVRRGRAGLACKRRQIARRHRRDVQGGGETGRKMPAGIVETSKPGEKQDKKCTPAR